ncbi:MAG TPA: APC family permease [Candidatus Sulfotelmatobacter sp.]|nr:APC family permease [Candidatus Sulfotelmatobacter sp.]
MSEPEKLERGLGLIEATALNMTFMVGIGPFIVVPFMIRAMDGPQCLIAWVVGAILAVLDGCVWAELGAAMPQAGGSYIFLREAYGAERWGRLMSFLFIWQTLFQAPMSISSGALGFADYSAYLAGKIRGVAQFMQAHPRDVYEILRNYDRIVAAMLVLIAVILLYRRITTIGKISVALCAILLGTILWLIYGGATQFNAARVFTFPAGAWNFSWIFFAGLGHASVQAVYSYLGYYNVCNLGGEMKYPEKNIPRAIFLSIFGIAILYFAMQTSILAVVPWQEAANSPFVASLFFLRRFGENAATFSTALILVTAFGSVFSATLGYSRVPYAAAKDGNFFAVFGRIHPTKHFPHISLLAIGAVSVVICLTLPLYSVIRSILAMRCLIQFAGQAVGLLLLHARGKTQGWPFHMRLYPLPAVLAIAGWLAIFISTGRKPMVVSLVAMAAGILVYLGRARWLRQWPFERIAA